MFRDLSEESGPQLTQRTTPTHTSVITTITPARISAGRAAMIHRFWAMAAAAVLSHCMGPVAAAVAGEPQGLEGLAVLDGEPEIPGLRLDLAKLWAD